MKIESAAAMFCCVLEGASVANSVRCSAADCGVSYCLFEFLVGLEIFNAKFFSNFISPSQLDTRVFLAFSKLVVLCGSVKGGKWTVFLILKISDQSFIFVGAQ